MKAYADAWGVRKAEEVINLDEIGEQVQEEVKA
jgi:hypothetical protein